MGVPSEKVEWAVRDAARDLEYAVEHEERDEARAALEAIVQALGLWREVWGR